ncbi:MAG: hypothetical protein ACI9UA_001039 [Pseudoalteromonas tetraodonis]|jgi:hypothetical protein
MKTSPLAWLASLALVTNAFCFDSIVVFNEVQYHPASDDSMLEFIELYNQNTVDVDLSGWRLSGGVDFDFVEGTVIDGQGYLVIAASPATLEASAGISAVLGPFTGQLENKGELLRLRNRNDRIMDEIEFNDRFPWPVAADGSGATLAKLNPRTPSHEPEFWRASFQNLGTPGTENFQNQSGGPPTTSSALLAIDADWRYNESGSDLGADWATSSHAPAGDWKTGPGMLAYETSSVDPNFNTELIRPALNTPFVITYYFETEINLSQVQIDRLHALTFTHRIDDGAIFYLNGVEVLRDNMPNGAVSAATQASRAGEFSVEGPVEVPFGGLQVGSNRISVEVHQGGGGSSDVVFGLEIDMLELLPDPGDPDAPSELRLNEIAPADAANWWVEIANTGTQPIDLLDHVIATGGTPPMESILQAQTVSAGGFVVIDAASLGFTPPSNERLFLYGPGKASVIDAADMKNSLQARDAESGDDEFRSPIAATPGTANIFLYHDEIVINEIMYSHRPDYEQKGEEPSIQPIELFGYAQTWRYNEEGDNLGANWASSSHPLGGDWSAGTGPLGWESSGASIPIPLATVISRPAFNTPFVITHYFETDFELTASELVDITQLQITHMIDDGAIFYLNGQELGRHNMPGAVVSSSTLALSGLEATEQNFLVTPELLISGTNRISVEVHQVSSGSSDIVMGLKLSSLQEIPSQNPPIDYAENPEEWIELHNHSGARVDLGGWKFDRGIGFEFPAGTQLAADGYLVIARDAATLAAKFPGITIGGDFSGSLSNSGERLRLSDAAGNPADEVFYRDGAPWPSYTDAGGCSLELRNPHSDNASAGAWAPSDNSTSSEWRNYSVTITAQNPTYRPGQFNFHELRLGLLDDGECLLDDVSVVEDPNGSPRELMQNGSFNSGANAWRLLGTHEESQVVSDAGNPALHVVATSGMNYMNNLLESSLRSGGSPVPVQAGTDYHISFRAKWLSGSPQFRAELYYNKVAKNFILTQAASHGSPGIQNSTFENNIGPTFADTNHDPAVPPANTPVTVSTKISDPDGVASAQLHYAVSGGAFQTAAMAETSTPGVWSAEIPGQSSATKVQFYIEATDSAGSPASANFPAAGSDSRAMVQVADGRSSSSRQNIRLIMTNADSSAMHNSNDLLQNRRLGCTVITNETDIAYGCGVRLRGSMFSRQNAGGTGLNIKFPNDRPFRGIHKSITTRQSGRIEILGKHMINHAGGMHDNYNDVAQLIHTTQNGTAVRLSMARFGSPYVKGLAGGRGSEGTVFKMEGIREIQGTTDGNTESQKTPFPVGWVSNFDIADQGDDKEIYRHNMRINSNVDRDDYTSIIAMCKAFSLSGQALEDEVQNTINVDMWMRQFAILSLCGVGDTYSHGNPHNLNFYVRPGDGLVEPMPWDWDFMFNRDTTSSLWGNRNFSKIPSRPVFTRLFHGHMHDLINTTFNQAYMDDWLSHYSSLMGEGYTGWSTYIRERGNYVLGQLPTEIPFTITTNGGNAFTVDVPSATLAGNAWVNVKQIRINDSPIPSPPVWTDANSWVISIPVNTGANEITLTAIDFQGVELGSDIITITSTSTITPAAAGNLVISELMYNPAGGSEHEYLELKNINPSLSIDLSGVRFTSGIEFDFPDGTTIAPGAYALLVRDLGGFNLHYGSALPVIGTFANDTKLSNGGEEIAIADGAGFDIQRFTYDDAHPWPTSADGDAPSLVLMLPDSDPDHTLPQNWRASAAANGSPGGSDATTFSSDPDADTDQDGFTDLLEYALGSQSNQAASQPQQAITPAVAAAVFTFTALTAADDVVVTPEISTDLNSWSSAGLLLSRTPQGDGIESRSYRFDFPSENQPAFVRLKVEQR